jgi:hypothetical protein
MAARNRTWTPEIVRQRIRTSMLIRRLQKQALGKLVLTDGEQRAIAILLRKTLPDLTAVDLSGSVEMTKPDEISDSILAHIASTGSDRVTEEASSQEEPSELH